MEKFEVMINGVKPEIREMVTSSMQTYYDQLQELLAPAMAINVTDVNDVKGMRFADEYRKKLVKVRTGTEAKRKELKADYIATGKIIDTVAKSIQEETIKAEEHLRLQATYAERVEAERLDIIEAERTKELKKYVEFTDMYNLREMNDTVWETTISGAKLQYEATEAKRIEAARLEAEAAAAAKAKAEAEEKERVRLIEENKRLQQQAEIRAKAQQLEREEYNRRVAAEQAERAKERAAHDAEMLRKINEAKAEADAAAQKQMAQQAEAMKKAVAEAKQQAIEARETAKLDYEKYKSTATIQPKCSNSLKLVNFANEKELLTEWINRFEMPEMETDSLSLASQEKIKTIHSKVTGFKVWAKNQL